MTYPFVQARHYTKGGNLPLKWLVVHTMESPEAGNTAEGCAAYFAGPNAPQASAHYCIDERKVIQCVHDQDVAWHDGHNQHSLGFEHAGRASQTPKQWADNYSRAMLQLSATLVAAKCVQYDIPAVRLTVADLIAGKKGLCGHVDVSRAFHGSDHTDPGPAFPWLGYLGFVRAHIAILKHGKA